MRPTFHARALTCAFLSLFAGCSTQRVETSFAGDAMGTTWSVKVIAAGALGEREQQAAEAIRAALDDVNAKMSTYRADSELSRFNARRTEEPFPVSRETMAVFEEARRIGELTAGAFDVTVGPLVNAWGFGPGERREDLDQAALDELRSHTGWDKLVIDPGESTLAKLDTELYADLSAIAKGYAVDRVSAALSDLGWPDHMVEVGGEVRASGRNAEGRPWRIAVEKPVEGGRAIQRVVGLENLAMATSGDYRNYFERDGRRYSHEIDPATGYPVEHQTASVTVLEPTCAAADALATGLIVMGEERGFARAVELEIAALFLVREGDGFVERATPAFERVLKAGAP